MTEKANPSINRPAEAFKTAGAIAYGGSDEGFISPSNEPTEISVQDSEIDESQLSAFDETSSAGSLDITIDGGEAFVFGSWLAIDTQTTVSLQASTSAQTVSVGWNKNGSDDVIIGLDAAFSSAGGDADKKIPLFSFDTDSSGVTNVVDERSFDQISADSVEQGAGSGLDADTVDGEEASELSANAGDNLSKSGNTLNVIGGSGSGLDADTVDGVEASELASDVSDDGTTVTSSSTDLNFTDNITASDDGDGTSSISIDDSFVLNNGDTMSGELDMGSNKVTSVADPTSAQDAVTKAFADSTFVDTAGDTMSGNLDMDSNKVVGLNPPTQDDEVARKAYVDSTAEGLDIKEAVRVCTCGQGNIDLSSSTDPNPIDTVTLNDGDRILLIEQTDATENGIYEAVDADDPTTWIRPTDANDDIDVNSGMFVLATEGSESGNVGFVLITPNPIDVGVTPLNFTRFSGAEAIEAGDNISRTGSRLDVDDSFVLNNGDTMTGDLTISGALFADQSTGNLDISGTLTENSSI